MSLRDQAIQSVTSGDIIRFKSKLKIGEIPKGYKTPCHVWTAGKYSTGYGKFGVSGQSVRAHRVAAFLKPSIGTKLFTAGMMVQHGCNNRSCCNPRHIRLGTNSSNQRHSVKSRNHIAGMKKLTEYDVARIKLHLIKGETIEELAYWFGVSMQLVSKIKNGHVWKDVEPLPDTL